MQVFLNHANLSFTDFRGEFILITHNGIFSDKAPPGNPGQFMPKSASRLRSSKRQSKKSGSAISPQADGAKSGFAVPNQHPPGVRNLWYQSKLLLLRTQAKR